MFRSAGGSPFKKRGLSLKKEFIGKIHIFTEGVKTEQLYFNALKSIYYGQYPEIIIYDRISLSASQSHALNIVKRIIQTEQAMAQVDVEDKELLEKIVKDKNENLSTKDSLRISSILDKFGSEIYSNEENIEEQINAFLNLTSFDKNIDTLLIVLDRDAGSFTENQYDEVMSLCKKHGYTMTVTNPCIELFLLLHFREISSQEKTDLLINKKRSGKTYAFNLLKTEMKNHGLSYTKSKYNAEDLIKRFNSSKKNSENLETDINSLKTNVGTNLINELSKIIEFFNLDDLTT